MSSSSQKPKRPRLLKKKKKVKGEQHYQRKAPRRANEDYSRRDANKGRQHRHNRRTPDIRFI